MPTPPATPPEPAPQRHALPPEADAAARQWLLHDPAPHAPPSTRLEEWRSFLFFTVVMAPVLAVAIVGGYGFLVWMYQLIAGPPQG